MMTEWDDRNRQIVQEGRAMLDRTGQSIIRSNQIAVETETIGTVVVSELGEQRETLLRAKNRLDEADSQLNNARKSLRKMGRAVVYNKIILILIIVLETAILIGCTYIKIFK